MRGDKFFAAPSPVHEMVHFFRRTVIHGHRIALTFHIEHQILAHHGESDQPDVCQILHLIVLLYS